MSDLNPLAQAAANMAEAFEKMAPTEAPLPPRCPACNEDDVESFVDLVEHGYHIGRVVWDATVCDWVMPPDVYINGWNGTETYWQCGECGWQGGDPLGLEDDDA